MAILSKVKTDFGFDKKLYIRLNSLEVSKHGGAIALFRGFDSKEAFEGGAKFMYEMEVLFVPDVGGILFDQAYAEIKKTLTDCEDA
jgi:hypothetical protein